MLPIKQCFATACLTALAAGHFVVPVAMAQDGEQKAGEERVSDRRAKMAEERFRENIGAALSWMQQNRAESENMFLKEDIEAIRKALESETFDEYFAEQAKILGDLQEKGTPLQPTIFLVADFGHMLRVGRDTDRVSARLLETTRTLYGPKAAQAFREKYGKVRRLTPAVYADLKKWWQNWEIIIPKPEPVDDTSEMNCSTEIGWSSANLDGATACLPPGATRPTSGSSQYLSSSGLLAQLDIPLEPQLTCTKNQRRRGTCVGFAITASLETRGARARKKKFNFSEQYNYFKSEIYTGNGRYSYGLPTQSVVDDWGDGDWQTGRETAWTYNRGLSMDPIDTGSVMTYRDNVYPDSCVGYSGYCTDYAFQGTPNSNHSVFTRPSPQSTQDSFGAKTAYQYTWGLFTSRADVLEDEIIPLLNRNIPVIVSYTVTDNYMNMTGDYLVWSSSDSQRSGGHATLIVGYVAKEDLPSSAPTPVGTGYFIIKNSWGAGRADCGYEYIDEKWLREQMRGLSSLSVQ